MKPYRSLIAVTLCGAVVAAGAQNPRVPANPPTTTPVSDRERFAVLSDQNMFMKDRARRMSSTSRPATTRPAETILPPEKRYVLRGVVYEDDTFHAYFENIKSSEMVQAVVGTALASGHVAELSLDAVAFENDGVLTWVKVGDDLTGGRSTETPTSRPTVAGDGAATTSPASGAALSSVEERMRQRRQQSSGGR